MTERVAIAIRTGRTRSGLVQIIAYVWLVLVDPLTFDEGEG